MFSERWRGFKNNVRRDDNLKISTNPFGHSLPHFPFANKRATILEDRSSAAAKRRADIVYELIAAPPAWARSRADSIAETVNDWPLARRVRSRRYPPAE